MIADLGVLTASQALGGFGRGLVFAPLATLSIRRVPPRERGAAMGVFQAVYALGMFLGPATSGALAEWLGLDRMFLVVAALSIMGALAAARWLGRDEPRPKRARCSNKHAARDLSQQKCIHRLTLLFPNT